MGRASRAGLLLLLGSALLSGCISSDLRHRRAIDESGLAAQRAQEGRFFYYTPEQIVTGTDSVLSQRGASQMGKAGSKGGWWSPLAYQGRRLIVGLLIKPSEEVSPGIMSDKKEPYMKISWSAYDVSSGQRALVTDPALLQNLNQELNMALYQELKKKFGYESLSF